MVRNAFRRFVPFATAALMVALESTASGQYFGRNKVQYKDLDFQVLRTEHFDIYFYPSERAGSTSPPAWPTLARAAGARLLAISSVDVSR